MSMMTIRRAMAESRRQQKIAVARGFKPGSKGWNFITKQALIKANTQKPSKKR